MTSTRFSESSARMLSALVLTMGCASMALAETVTLKDGKTYEVQTVRGLPVGFANDQIRVRDIGIIARFKAEQADAPPYVWSLLAELMEQGRFVVVVTTLLDEAASATFEVKGPGKIEVVFFPQAEFPKAWEGIDQPGIHWFPFHFVFEEKESKKRFQFTQWAQIDDRTWRETRSQVERLKQEMLKKQQKRP
jgi:hypothetical protein